MENNKWESELDVVLKNLNDFANEKKNEVLGDIGYIPSGEQIPEKPSHETITKIADAKPPQMGE